VPSAAIRRASITTKPSGRTWSQTMVASPAGLTPTWGTPARNDSRVGPPRSETGPRRPLGVIRRAWTVSGYPRVHTAVEVPEGSTATCGFPSCRQATRDSTPGHWRTLRPAPPTRTTTPTRQWSRYTARAHPSAVCKPTSPPAAPPPGISTRFERQRRLEAEALRDHPSHSPRSARTSHARRPASGLAQADGAARCMSDAIAKRSHS
jgi:hypothetical protein